MDLKDKTLISICRRLYSRFGPQGWWPGKTSFEVAIGAILTQNTAWANVEKAIKNLKRKDLLNPKEIKEISVRQLASLIRPSGYYNIKAKRVKNFLDFLFSKYRGNLKNMLKEDTYRLKEELLNVKGIGQETADSILLYALNKPIFVVDAYTKRILLCLGLIDKNATYSQIQDYFMENLPRSSRLFNEFHALFVRLGKDFCRKSQCQCCPLKVKKDVT
jgi:endonuclease-3 related protein